MMPYHHLRFSTLLGTFPYTGSGRFSTKYAVYSSVVLLGFFYEVFALSNSQFVQETAKAIRIGWLIFGLISLKKKLVVVMSVVHTFKLILNRTTVSEIYRISGAPDCSLAFSLAFTTLVVKFTIDWIAHDFTHNRYRMINGLVTLHVNLAETTMLLQFCGFLKNFHRQLENLYLLMKEQKVINVSALVDKHAQILTHMKQSNAIYSHQILSGCIVYGEFMIFNLLMLVMGFMNNTSILDLAFNAFGTFFYFSILCYLSTCCQRTMETANEFNVELFQLMRNNHELYCNDKLLLYVKMKQTVQFSACGFFTLGFPLLTSIMAVVTTYLVILLQFS